MSIRFYTYEERPELRERAGFLRYAWPAFMLESPISNERWHLLYERFPRFQFWMVDEATDEILAEGNSLPARLDLDELPDSGWEYVMEHATAGDEEPTLVSAIQVLVDRERHGRGLSALMLAETAPGGAGSLRGSGGTCATEHQEYVPTDFHGALRGVDYR